MRRLAVALVAALLSGCTPSLLQDAAREGRAADVDAMLARGADPNKGGGGPANDCATPLSCAVRHGRFEIAARLLAAGADPGKTGGKFPPLRYALQQKDPAFTELLLDFGADPKQRGHVLWETQLALARQFRSDLLPLLEAAAAGTRTPRYRRGVGLLLEEREGRISVAGFLTGSPAANAGLQAGDVLVDIGGRPAAGMTVPQAVEALSRAPGARVSLTLDRAGITPEARAALNLSREGGTRIKVTLPFMVITPAMRERHEAAVAQSARVASAAAEADAHAAAGRREEALRRYGDALRALGWEADHQGVRIKAIRVALAMDPPPPVPESAREHARRAQAHLKLATSNDDFLRARDELFAALMDAPWWADAYVNYSLVTEKLGHHAWAIWALKTHQLIAPDGPDAADIKNKLVELEIAAEKARRTP
ncbi:MAG: PDZ domain-containing protein [Elusimicrobia bacterium]|nr:PDZ domain-containing protein [Elusimicrobiota bacterium]